MALRERGALRRRDQGKEIIVKTNVNFLSRHRRRARSTVRRGAATPDNIASSSLPRERSECGEGGRCEATVGWGAHFVENITCIRVVFETPHPGLRFASALPPRKGVGEESSRKLLLRARLYGRDIPGRSADRMRGLQFANSFLS